MRKLALSIITGTLCALTSAWAEPTEGWRIDRQHVEYPVKAGQAIEIHNAWGDVRVRPIDDPHVAVFAARQMPPEEEGELSIKAGRGEALRLEVVHSNPEAVRGRVDLACFVPSDVRLTVHTTDGSIEVKSVPTHVQARSVAGDILVKKPRWIDAYSETGDILVLLEAGRWSAAPRLATSKGDITLRLLENAPVNIATATGGAIQSDYPCRVRQAPDALHRARVKVRRGGLLSRLFGFLTRKARISIESVSGDIRLLRPFPELRKS